MATRIHSNTQHTLVIKHSTFIAHLMRAMDFGEARLLITALKAQHPMASHVTFAFRSAREERSSDAGEPVGSAGKVQLKILREKDLVDVVSVVIRYYGGTPLGLPGLTRAYGEALLGAFEKAPRVVLRAINELIIVIPITKLDSVKRYHDVNLHHFSINPDGMSVTLEIYHSDDDPLPRLMDLCAGNITVVSHRQILQELHL